MNQSLPKNIKAYRKKYKIKHVSKKASIKTLDDYGECSFINQIITIFGNQPNLELADTLLHECCHAYIEARQIRFKNSKEEEKYIRKFTSIVLYLFKDNKNLFKCLEKLIYS